VENRDAFPISKKSNFFVGLRLFLYSILHFTLFLGAVMSPTQASPVGADPQKEAKKMEGLARNAKNQLALLLAVPSGYILAGFIV
jgi:hypothetical protein